MSHHAVLSRTRILSAILLTVILSVNSTAQLTLLNDMVLDNDALLMPTTAPYGRSINAVSFQAEQFLTYDGYQYASWYHLGGGNEDVYLARRNLSGTTWEAMDTGRDFNNGDASPQGGSLAWDAHNTISMGISGDGRIHLSFDHHGNNLRYITTNTGVANSPGGTWNSSIFTPERSSLNAGGGVVTTVTYPQFITDSATGDVYMNYRTGTSGAGDMQVTTYNSDTGLWNTPHQFINGTTAIDYDDAYGALSSNRNAYLNGFDIDTTGRIHTTWTWRETATGSSNHDIAYAYSDNGGDTWKNNAGTVIATLGNPINLNSPGINIDDNNPDNGILGRLDRGNTLMNQQTQAVDLDDRVHTIMWHKRDDAAPLTGFSTTPAAYFHYFRDPTSGAWDRTELPTTRAVGSRPDVAYDENGNLYVAYVSPGPGDTGGFYTNGDLIVASASKAAGYEDWEIVYTDTRDFAGEPTIDLNRLLENDIVSIFIQENDAAQPNATGTPLHVLEFNKLTNQVVWSGDDTGNWSVGSGTDWDNDNNNAGDTAFEDNFRVTFDDDAADFSVNIASPVAPTSTTFKNTSNNYTVTGTGIVGGSLRKTGNGVTTLANSGNFFTGDTSVESGTLALASTATLNGSPVISVDSGAELDVTATTNGLPLTNQTLTGTGLITGNVIADSGLVRVGGAGLPSTGIPVTTIVDDFNDANLSEYTKTAVLDFLPSASNVAFSSAGGNLVANYGGTAADEQVLLLRDDITLAVGETLAVDVAMGTTSQQLDFGLAISATDSPTAASGADTDTRNLFNWASVSVRPSQNSIRVNQSSSGTVNTTTGTLGAVETSVTGLYITRISPTQFTLGYTDSALMDIPATTVSYTASNVGTAIGFYAHLNSGGSLGTFDNLRILGFDDLFQGETFTIAGDLSLLSSASLELDIYSPLIGDILDISGNLNAGGTLVVSLEPTAPAPMLGDRFEILNFGSANGSFDAFDLPPLASGLAWNVSDVLTTGELEIVTDVDLDNDGDVDGRDFLLIQRMNPLLTAAWQAQYGNQVALPLQANTTVVPEPAMSALWSIGVSVTALGRWSFVRNCFNNISAVQIASFERK